jgi:4-hydroxybenzoate-CoA ligase
VNLARYCLTNASPDPDKVALEVIGTAGERLEIWTYADLTRSILSVANGLRLEGFERGDRVLLRIGHSSDFPLLFFGLIAAGLVPVPTSALLTGTETDTILSDCGAAVVVHDGKTALPQSGPARVIGPRGDRSAQTI